MTDSLFFFFAAFSKDGFIFASWLLNKNIIIDFKNVTPFIKVTYFAAALWFLVTSKSESKSLQQLSAEQTINLMHHYVKWTFILYLVRKVLILSVI